MSANVSQNYYVLGQAPLDAKIVFENKQAFIDYTLNNEFFAFNFYKGMLVYLQEEEILCIWEFAYSPIYEENEKILPNNFIYPLGTVFNGLDYSEKAFNLIEVPINKPNIGQWNNETLNEKTLTIVVDESTISNVFVPEQITEIWPQAEKISFIDGNINGIKFQGKQIKYNEEFSLLDWDQLTYEVWNSDAAYIQNAKMRVIMVGESIDYNQYNNKILGNSFNEIGIISENVSAKNKNSIYFSSEGNSFDILIVDKFFVVRKLSDYYSKKDASNVSQNAIQWRQALELYSITEIQGLYMALQDFVSNGKIRSDKIEALGLTELIPVTQTSLPEFISHYQDYTYEKNDIIAIPDNSGNYLLYIFKGGEKTISTNYISTKLTNITIGMVQGLQTVLNNKQDKLSSFDESILIGSAGNIESNVSLLNEYFNTQNCVLNFTPIQILGVYKNGLKLKPTEYTVILPKTISINTYIDENIEIQYTHLKNIFA